MLINTKEEGISGNDKICTLHPFEVLNIIEKEKNNNEDENESSVKIELPKDMSAKSIITWLINILTILNSKL